MHKIALDTSMYISLLRKNGLQKGITESTNSIFYFSAVVAQELYAGAVDRHTINALDELYDIFLKYDRIIVPSKDDWQTCGIVLSKIGKKYGFESIKKGRLVNDVLIALSCKNSDATLLTTNSKDFGIIHEFINFRFLGIY